MYILEIDDVFIIKVYYNNNYWRYLFGECYQS